ncbi:hypothetical protein [Winogradskyella sp.]|uniref:hypothetical protein n=1 Tax=Winogradskyella sp. TaxID=1883156 RepID=UPI0026242EDA|nr:hypothetical protein [Winogradskyella sp.]
MKNTKTYFVLSSSNDIQDVLIKSFAKKKNKSITFNAKSCEKYILISDYADIINYDFNRNGFSIYLFECFLKDFINQYDCFLINSSGLSYSSIEKLTLSFYKKISKVKDKKLFFIHNVDKLGEEELVIRKIDEFTHTEMEKIIKKYKNAVDKELEW